MLWTSLVAAALTAAEPCEPPRVRDTAPLVAAMAQDKVLGLAFLKAAGLCAERGEACDQARLECNTLLNQTIQKQVGFDEGQWLRDLLLPYNGGTYPVTRQFPAAQLASDTSCNVEVAALEAAAQRRQAQAGRRDGLYQEYQLYARWTQVQLQACKDRVAADDAKSAQARAEAERLAAVAAAASATEALRQKQAQEAAQAKAETERRAREAAEAQAKKERDAKDAAERDLKERKDAEARAREEREQDRKAAEARAEKLEADRKKDREDAEAQRKHDKAEAEAKAQREKEEAERTAKEAEEKRLVTERDKRVADQRAYKSRLVTEAEAALKAAQDQEIVKKQLALDAVSASPAIAQAAVAEAAAAERTRVDAEKKLAEAKAKAEAIVIDDSHERSAGSAVVAGGAHAMDTGFGLAVLGAIHFGFWGTAPSDGMASGLELRLWGRYTSSVTGPSTQAVESMLTARYFFGVVGVGLAGELRLLEPLGAAPLLVGGTGPSLAFAFLDTRETRVVLGLNYLPLGSVIDTLRFFGNMEVSWRFLTFQVNGGTLSRAVNGVNTVGWQVGAAVGLRAAW